ncbi:MAG: heavy metal-binding domain-containing protein [Verrucomicrobiota bacterium]
MELLFAQGDAEAIAGLVFFLLFLGFPLALLFGSLILGKWIERSHFKSLDLREGQLKDIMTTDLREPVGVSTAHRTQLVSGASVIATDYFKKFAAGIRKIFGGEFKSLETLQRRGRREAVVRMLTEARALGATQVYNVRIETSTIAGKSGKTVNGVEILSYGTALIPHATSGQSVPAGPPPVPGA